MLFVLTNLLLVLLVWRLLPLIAPPGGPWTRALCALLLALALMTGILLAIGLAHLLNPLAQAGLLAVLLAGVVGAEVRLGWPSGVPVATEQVTGALTVVSGALLGAALGVWFGRPGWTGTGFCFDDITYHAAIVAHWVQWGTIEYTPFSYQSYYAFNSELVSLWFWVPLGEPSQSGLAVLLFVLLVVLGTMSIAETHALHPAVPLGLLAAMFASHRMLYFARTFSSTDLAMAGYVLAALALAVRPPSRRAALWCGLAGGLAIGTKVSAVPALGLVGLWWLWRARRGRVALPALFVAGLLAFGAYWYVRNLIHTGNPLFPAQIGPFEGPLEPETARKTALIHFMEKKGDRSAFWYDLFVKRFDWPVFLGIPAIAGYLVALVSGFWRDRRGLWLVASVGILFLLLHPFQPFSATINRPSAPLHGMVRYLTLFFVIGLPLVAFLLPRRRWAVAGLAVGSWMAFAASVYYATKFLYGASDALWLLAGASAGLVVMGLLGSVPRGAVPAVLSVAIVALALRTPAKAEHTATKRTTFSPIGRVHTKAWDAIDALPSGAYVAWLSDMPPTHMFSLPLMGRQLQYHLVPVDRHGKRVDALLHERWRDEPALWWWEFNDRARNDEEVVGNLLNSGAEYLVISRCHQSTKGGWPRPRGSLNATDATARRYGDRCVEIWDIERFRGVELQKPKRKPKPKKPAPKAPVPKEPPSPAGTPVELVPEEKG
ncbi:MAG: hypothetical protein H6737_11465 [Alphaproteobacteria bacterium]|nr:hypothetical protein [Alphaproteobacteria bacterium]